MKIAITSTGTTTQSKLDSRFGRCAHLAIYNTETKGVEFIENTNRESSEGAGPATAQLVASQGVSKVISGEFGGKVKSILETLKIEMVAMGGCDQTIDEIIETLKSGIQ